MSTDPAALIQPQSARPFDWRRWFPRIVLALIVLASTFRPGDVPWINDEPSLIQLGLVCNSSPSDNYIVHLPFTPAPMGLQGTRGVYYGPFPAWIYQVFLAFSHDPRTLVVMCALLVGAVTAVSLDWLAATLGVSPWLAVVTMLSPWLWFYSRQLWDNSFCIPLAALTLAAYAHFLHRNKLWSLILTIMGMQAMFLAHLMSLALIGPIALHLCVYRGRELLRRLPILLCIVVVTELAAYPYWLWLWRHHDFGPPGDTSFWAGWGYPLLGAHHLTAAGFGNILGDDWFKHLGGVWVVIFAAQTISLIAYPVVWAGMIAAYFPARRAVRNEPGATTLDHICAICICIWLAQTALDAKMHVSALPHYYNATWIVFVVFAWVAVDRLMRKPDFRWLAYLGLAVQSIAMIVVTIGVIAVVIRDTGAISEGYGTALSNQIETVQTVEQYVHDLPTLQTPPFWKTVSGAPATDAPGATTMTSTPAFTVTDGSQPAPYFQWQHFSHAAAILAMLFPPAPAVAPPAPQPKIEIRYRNDFSGDASIIVIVNGVVKNPAEAGSP